MPGRATGRANKVTILGGTFEQEDKTHARDQEEGGRWQPSYVSRMTAYHFCGTDIKFLRNPRGPWQTVEKPLT